MKILSRFCPALTERNYQLHFFGQLISFSGLWLQLMAQKWCVNELTHSQTKVGYIVSAPWFMTAAVVLLGGFASDRFSKRWLIFWTQIVSAILCFALAIMFFCHCETVAGMIVISLIFGAMIGIDNPARHSLAPELVKKENIGSAVAISAMTVMLAQTIGPGFGGWLLGHVNAGWAFVISGITPFAVIVTLPFMRPNRPKKCPEALGIGFRYVFSEPTIRLCAILIGLISFLGFSCRSITPAAADMYKSGAWGIGCL
ncbi:MAG: MFS transporter, partial [Candidatus Staskawiczbacteria bacterium]